ncbi:retrovirus-related pol polyprotein from transposon TNT 1-94 [Tanacetum coccineum]
MLLRLHEVMIIKADDLLYYDAEMELMNMILLSIPNEIYNSMDSCKTAKQMWDHVERLMRGTIQNQVDRRNNGFPISFDQFVAATRRVTSFIYNLRLAKKLTVDSFDDLFDYLLQFEKLVNASRAKKYEKSHDPLTLVAHTAITQNFSNPTNNRLRASSNTRNQAVVQGDRVNIQSRNSGNVGRNNRRAYVMLQMRLQMFKGLFELRLQAILQRVNDITVVEKDIMRGIVPCQGTIDDDQINSNIQFDYVKGNVNSGSVEKDTHVFDLCALETLARNAYKEAAKQQRFAQKVQQQNETLTSQIEMYKERNRTAYFRMSKSIYVASRTGNIEIPLNVRDSEETLEEAFKKSFVEQTCPSSPYTSPGQLSKIWKQKQCQNSKRASMFYTSQEEIALNAFCRDQLRPENGENGTNATSSVKKPKSRDSHVKTSVLDVSKNKAKKEAVYVRKNKQTNNTFANVVLNKENVIDVAVANDSKAKTLLCVSCMQSVLIPCHDKCIAKHKLNVRSNARRTFSVNSRIPKSSKTTVVASKTSASKARDKVVQIVLWIVDSGCSKHMTGDCSLLRNFVEKFMGTVRFRNDNFSTIIGYGDYIHGNHSIRTDNVTEFKNATLKAHYEKLGIMQQFSIARTPQQNGVVERRNHTLVEAARTMLIFSRLPEFLWAEVVATAYFTQNRSIINTRYNKTPYELLHGRKPNVEYFHVFGSLCYPTNDRDDLGKMKPKADIRVFIGYSETSREPDLQRFNNPNSSDDLMNTPSKEDLDNLFGLMFEDYFEQKSSDTTINSAAQPTHDQEDSPSTSLNHEIKSSTTNLEPSNVHNFHQVQPSTHIWTKDHPLDQVIGDPSKPVMTRQRLHTDFELIESMQDELNQFERLQVWELVPQPGGKNGYKQEEGIDFEESFAPVAHLRLFGCSSNLPGIFISQSQYAIELLKKHGLDECVSMRTAYGTRTWPDLQGTPTDQTNYRPRPTVKHLKEVKRIFWYLRQSYNIGLWYPKDSGFELIAYSDADHAGCKDDCKSTSGGLQFLGGKLVSWSSKKQD